MRTQTIAREREYATDHGGSQWLTYRRCPECGHRMVTTGLGWFWCEPCGYKDKQDVQPLRDAGLDYPIGSGWNREFAWSKEE